jgi:hypothetical protein
VNLKLIANPPTVENLPATLDVAKSRASLDLPSPTPANVSRIPPLRTVALTVNAQIQRTMALQSVVLLGLETFISALPDATKILPWTKLLGLAIQLSPQMCKTAGVALIELHVQVSIMELPPARTMEYAE